MTGLFYQWEELFIADQLDNMGRLMDFGVKKILSTTSKLKYEDLRQSRRPVFASLSQSKQASYQPLEELHSHDGIHMCANLSRKTVFGSICHGSRI